MFPKHLVLYRKQQHKLLPHAHEKKNKVSSPHPCSIYACNFWFDVRLHHVPTNQSVRSEAVSVISYAQFPLKTGTLPLEHWATSKKIVHAHSLHTNHAKTSLSFQFELFSFYSLMPWQNRPIFRVMKTTWKLISHAQDIRYLTVWFSLDMLPCLS